MGEVIRNGKIDPNSVKLYDDGSVQSYVYNLNKDGVNFGVVVEEGKDGKKKTISMFSDRNFIKKGDGTTLGQPSPTDTIIPQNTEKCS
ncbi:MAG: hypothetical protein LBG67_00235 [Campylobacteraceae bacterium]|jgi:hypothetical protein|nr:hypothetical protein [Campylobacteraceae bacterium]